MIRTRKSQQELKHTIKNDIHQLNENKLSMYIVKLNRFNPSGDIDNDTDSLNDIVKTFDRNALTDYFTLSETISRYIAHKGTSKNDLIKNSTGELIFNFYEKIFELNEFIQPTWIGRDGKEDIYIKNNFYFMKYTADKMQP